MQCRRCGKELGEYKLCSFCGYDNQEGNVREMTNAEKNFYDGVTIENGGSEEKNSDNTYRSKINQKQKHRYSGRTFYVSGSSNFFSKIAGKFFAALIGNEFLARLAGILIVVAFAALMFFVALPILFFILAFGIALFAISKIGR